MSAMNDGATANSAADLLGPLNPEEQRYAPKELSRPDTPSG